MDFKRNIKRYLRGEDVKAVKDKLLSLGYLHASTHDLYGNDSYKACKAFQSANNLESSGVVDIYTWNALFNLESELKPSVEIPAWYGASARQAIGNALAQVSDKRKDICLLALQEAIDPTMNNPYPRSFYIRGGNLYNKDLSKNVMTKGKLDSYFRKSGYAPYYDNGRKEMMLEASAMSGYAQSGADCSGGVVGLLRKMKIYESGFDANANTLYHSHCVRATSPKAGDFAWKDGHIGLVVGGGYAVEWVGGAYGCQLTKLSKRQCHNFVDHKMHNMGAWTAYGDPKKY